MTIKLLLLTCLSVFLSGCIKPAGKADLSVLGKGFINPPDSARPGVYWYFMDGNLSKEAMTADLEAMKKARIGYVLFLEVNVGIPRGRVDFLSEEWQDLFVHAVRECERLGIVMTLGVGPGWTGSGGPWVQGNESMKHLVVSTVQVSGQGRQTIAVPKPDARNPYFGIGNFTDDLSVKWADYYEDVALLAFPSKQGDFRIQDIDEKALYYREPYTSKQGVKQYLPSVAHYDEIPEASVIPSNKILDITGLLKADGTLEWDVPDGEWTIARFGSRNNGAVTRPAPLPGVGFEADKFDTAAINAHLENFTGKLLKKTGIPEKNIQGGLKFLHMDSWEMGAQNWSHRFRQEFTQRRGYDPLPWYPVYAGWVVESLEKSERFLWDLRLTAQELVIENHAMHLKKYGQKFNMGFSIEPYDMNPTADMELGAVADVPMCEFWSKGYGFNSAFSCIQAASIAHIEGKNVVAAEAFTAHLDAWKLHPGNMKNQGDWAFATGINRLVYHTFQHQALPDQFRPGMTMGPYGVHHDRNQTWWPMADGYHTYVSRCQYILQNGHTVADILYLTPEGAPHVFRAPASAFVGDDVLPDKKGYNFDGCSPSQLMKASVNNGKVTFPSGASYHLLVLPDMETMTPDLLAKIESLIKTGATVTGNPPKKSPGLTHHPDCDNRVEQISLSLWGGLTAPAQTAAVSAGKGRIYWGGMLSYLADNELYADYNHTAGILKELGILEDFTADRPLRYLHQKYGPHDIYFVSNPTDSVMVVNCHFRVNSEAPQLWHPLSGEMRTLPVYEVLDGRISIPLKFEPSESYFIIFDGNQKTKPYRQNSNSNFPEYNSKTEIIGPWSVAFDTLWGGPGVVRFDNLEDWTSRPEQGIRYYSGIAVYENNFNIGESTLDARDIFIDLGEVNVMARVWINGKDMGVAWTRPYRLKISDALVAGKNNIRIEVANLWPNRLIGDEHKPYDGIKDGKWPEWLMKGLPRTSGRYTFSSYRFYTPESPLSVSGLTGPVTIAIDD